MEIRDSGAGVFTSSLHSDKLLCLVILGTLCIAVAMIYVAVLIITLTVTVLVVLFVLSFLAVGIAFGITLAAVNGKTPAALKQILKAQ